MNRQDLLDMILSQAQPIIDSGEQHMPMLIGARAVGEKVELGIYAFASLRDKQVIADLCHKIVVKEKMYMAAWVSEAWAASIEQDDHEALEHQHDHGLENLPGRREVLLISIQDAQADVVWTIPISGEGKDRRLLVKDMEQMDQPGEAIHHDNRWKLFPKPQALN